jgi:hypothetical protein
MFARTPEHGTDKRIKEAQTENVGCLDRPDPDSVIGKKLVS